TTKPMAAGATSRASGVAGFASATTWDRAARRSRQGVTTRLPNRRPAIARITKAASSGQRGSRTSSLRVSCTVRNTISGRNRPNAISPATAASLSAWAMSGVAAAAGASTPRALISHLLHVRAAEQALGQEDERDGEDREGCDVLVVDREI